MTVINDASAVCEATGAPGEVTRLLHKWGRGDKASFDALAPLLYEEFRKLARHCLRRDGMERTLQTTALVHELYMRLAHRDQVSFENRKHFLYFAGQVMRYVLTERARNKLAQKRGAGVECASLDEAIRLSDGRTLDWTGVIAVDKALGKLERLDPRQSRIVELRFFVGLSNPEIAGLMQISPATVKREWRAAKCFLSREIGGN